MMNYSSSSTTQQKGLIPFMYDGEKHQEKEWLPSSSTSSTTQIDVELDARNEDDDDNDDKERQGRQVVVDGSCVEREHMFDKVVTPSDVGKLNRLVIPKQHAEKYFPLDSSTNNTDQKAGLLLNFEDLSGKSWRFRYSYWNSSQSYVMTKGWSRFVKEKQLSAGDIVSFQRGVGCAVGGDEHKFFIDWRRRPLERQPHHQYHHHLGTAFAVHQAIVPGSVTGWSGTPLFLRSHPYPTPTTPTSIWDHSSSISTNQLSQVNMMSNVPCVYGSPSTNTYASGVLNSHLPRGSLIFVRSSPLSPSIDSITPTHDHHVNSSSLYCHSRGHEGGGHGGGAGDDDDDGKVYESVSLIQRKAAKRSVRLFGVNVDCPPISHDDPN